MLRRTWYHILKLASALTDGTRSRVANYGFGVHSWIKSRHGRHVFAVPDPDLRSPAADGITAAVRAPVALRNSRTCVSLYWRGFNLLHKITAHEKKCVFNHTSFPLALLYLDQASSWKLNHPDCNSTVLRMLCSYIFLTDADTIVFMIGPST